MAFLSGHDVQVLLADYVRQRRKDLKWSRAALAERSTVPARPIQGASRSVARLNEGHAVSSMFVSGV
jgi:transcriptional regulator with XRE-family HTH domain